LKKKKRKKKEKKREKEEKKKKKKLNDTSPLWRQGREREREREWRGGRIKAILRLVTFFTRCFKSLETIDAIFSQSI